MTRTSALLSTAVLLALATVTASCWSSSKEEGEVGCRKDTDCKGIRICNADEECVYPRGAGDAVDGPDATAGDGGGGGTGGDGGRSDSGGTGGADTIGPGDSDFDGVPNSRDNCPTNSNPAQADEDGDTVGDACDNCKSVANVNQNDSDRDGTGNRCASGAGYDPDRDRDGDNVKDVDDNCIGTRNSSQRDDDNDGSGNACDNCPSVPNYQQLDGDSDGTGDACESRPAGMTCASKMYSVGGSSSKPNIYFLLDKSGSMGRMNRMTNLKSGLDSFFRSHARSANYGITTFSDNCSPSESLAMGSHSASQLTNSYSNMMAGGSTGTGGAIDTVDQGNRYGSNPGGNEAVVLITDGDANRCGASNRHITYAVNQARDLYNNSGVKLYVVGFMYGGSMSYLQNLAQAGGTTSPKSASGSSTLDTTLTSILNSVGGGQKQCTFDFSPSSSFDENKMWVEWGGNVVQSSDFSYDSSQNEVSLDSQACSSLRMSSASTVKITAGCPEECQSSGSESCNYEDDDCDGNVDEGCSSCSPEVCDGRDNDCDDETDEGCP